MGDDDCVFYSQCNHVFSGFYFYKMTETQEKETDKIMKNIIRRQEDLIQTQKDLMEKINRF